MRMCVRVCVCVSVCVCACVCVHMYCMCVCVHRDLKLDVIPREATGEIINPTDASIVHLYKRVSPSADLLGVCGVGIPPVSGGIKLCCGAGGQVWQNIMCHV